MPSPCSAAWAEARLHDPAARDAVSACLRTLAKHAPNDGYPVYLQGGHASLAGDARGALALFRRAVTLSPDHAGAYFELGNSLYGENDLQGAESSYNAALKVAPQTTLCYTNLGNLYAATGRAKRAARSYRLALALEPAGWNACTSANGFTNLLESGGRHAEAEAVAAAALGSTPGCHYASHNLARLRRRSGRHGEAVAYARRAIAGSPAQPEYVIGLGAALHSAGSHREASEVYRRALATSPADHRLQIDLASTLHETGRAAEALNAYATALPLQLAHAAATLPPPPPPAPPPAAADGGATGDSSARRRRRAVFYVRLRAHAGGDKASEDVWGPSTLARKGLGGSEEAVIFVSRQLALRGWAVVVYANPPAEDLRRADVGGVVWRPWHAIEAEEAAGQGVDVLVSWRNMEGALLLQRAAARYVWLQDIVDQPDAYHRAFVDAIDGIIVLSRFHRRGLPAHAARKAVLSANGIDGAGLVPPGPNAHWRFMYAAWPTAGLQQLLERWGTIRDALLSSKLYRSRDEHGRPRAAQLGSPTLAVYYGFPRWLEAMHGGEAWYPEWRNHMEEMLRQPGVEYHGMVNASTVARAYAASGFYVFPSDKPETSGVNLMKAQAMGAIPLTSRTPNSSFPEVCADFDMGPPVPKGAVAIQADAAWMGDWVRALIDAAATAPELLAERRAAMAERARSQFEWSRVVDVWHEAFTGEAAAPTRAAEAAEPSAAGGEAAAVAEAACAGEDVEFSFGSPTAISGTKFRPPATSDEPLAPPTPAPAVTRPSPPQPPVPPPSPPPPASQPKAPPDTPPGKAAAKAAAKAAKAAAKAKGSGGKVAAGKAGATTARSSTSEASRQPSGRCEESGGAEARMMAGRRRFDVGDLATAFDCFHSAAKLEPTLAEAWYMAGGMHVVAGQNDAAEPLFDKALAADPTHIEALFELANIELGRQAHKKAVRLFRRAESSALDALATKRDTRGTGERPATHLLPTILANLGNALSTLSRLPGARPALAEEAMEAYMRSVVASPPSCVAFNGCSNALESSERFDEAIAVSQRGISLLPDCEYAYYNLGRLLRSAQRNTEAPLAFAAAIRLAPKAHLYVNGLGTALHGAGRIDEARSAYKAAVGLAPGWASPYRNLGLLDYEMGGRAREALRWFGHTIAIDPTDGATYADMGTAYLELGELRTSYDEYTRALRLAPANPLAHANHVYLSTKLCQWRDTEESHLGLRRLVVDHFAALEHKRSQPGAPAPHLFLPPYHALAYDRYYSPADLLTLAAAYSERAAMASGAVDLPPPPPTPALVAAWPELPLRHDGGVSQAAAARRRVPYADDGRLVIGYMSTDLGDHPTSHLMRSFWRLQRQNKRVRAVCFARSNDRSAQRAHLAATCEHWVELTGMSWQRAADEIRRWRLMLLIDLNGHCGRPQFEILSLRPAPIQLTYMGHPGTSGAEYVQYALVDRATTPPRARAHFSEHLLCMHMWHVTDYRYAHAFDRKLGSPPRHAPPIGERLRWPAEARRDELGLPEHAFVFATFNQLYKVSPTYWQAWTNALRASATSRLWLLHFPLEASDNLARQAAAAGVSTARLVSAPTAERDFHLARASLADLFLDTAPYSGHTTSGDALWMGTPVLSIPGQMMQSRVALSYSANAGCPQPASIDSLRAYEAAATSIAATPRTAEAMRRCLERNRWTAHAFDTARWVEAFDEGARMIWEHHRYGMQAMHVLLPARHVAA